VEYQKVGSCFISETRENPVALWAWLVLGGVFFVDATVTLLRRLLRGERVYEAHGSHAYQWLARRWGSHAKVTCAVLIVNVFWLFPCAVFATLRPGFAAATVIFAFAPLVLLAIATLGRREANDREQRRQVRRRVNHLTGSPLGVTLSLRPDALH